MTKLFQINKGCVDVEYLIIGMLANNVYLVSDALATIVVDPTDEPKKILSALGERKLDAIFLTHHHFDHMGAAAALREASGAKVFASALDAPFIEEEAFATRDFRKTEQCPIDCKLADGDEIVLGDMTWKVIGTPGHTPGSICFYIEPDSGVYPDKAPVLLSGDTLFYQAHGRTDFEGGSPSDMRVSLARLAQLPDEALVLPGHNHLTTIAAERTFTLKK
jgi:glyoxylase-like metal-dependent hydrolase (beta-lactamase superfamily II)